MHKAGLVIFFAMLLTCGAPTNAHADTMQLSIVGTAYDTLINQTIDVSQGFPGVTIPLRSINLGTIGNDGSTNFYSPINSSISLELTLSDANRNLAGLTLVGTIQGGFSQPVGSPDVNASISGSTQMSPIQVYPGLPPGTIPGWLPNLIGTVSGSYVGGGRFATFETVLNLGLTNLPPPIPEPAPLAAYLAVALGSLAVRSRQGRRTLAFGIGAQHHDPSIQRD